jgi:hypothetical protein
MRAIRSSITTFPADWFGLEVTTAASLADAMGDILIGLASQINLPDYVRNSPLIVCEDFSSGVRIPNQNGLYYLSQP